MNGMMRVLGTFAAGVLFAGALSRTGFTSWDEVHGMFSFSDLRLTLTFGVAATLLAGAFFIAKKKGARIPVREIHKGSILGGVFFGLGWALSGACPSIAVVQLGEAQLGALWTFGGIFAGNWAYSVVQERWLKWPRVSCDD